MGGYPECVCLAWEEGRDQKDDGDCFCRHWAAGGLRGAGGYRETKGMTHNPAGLQAADSTWGPFASDA